jgi:hypothetical protein
MYVFSSWCIIYIKIYSEGESITQESLIYSPLFFLFLLSDAFFYSFFSGMGGVGIALPCCVGKAASLEASRHGNVRQSRRRRRFLLTALPRANIFFFFFIFFYFISIG